MSNRLPHGWQRILTGVSTAALLTGLAACGAEAPPPDTAGPDEAVEAPAEPASPADPSPGGSGYVLETLVPGGPFHGIHGLTFDNDGRLLAGSVVGATLYEVDPSSGAVSVHIGPPAGMADDVEQGPNGTLVWTAFSDGKVYTRRPDGSIHVVAEDLPGANSLAFNQDGRLFFTQVFQGDALYEADPSGNAPPRQIMAGMGGLNGFDFGPDGKLYGPLWFRGQIVRVDVDEGTLEVVADGFGIPAAANFAPDGQLYAVDTMRGEVVRVDIETGGTEVVARVPKAIDNLAFRADGALFLTVMADNAIHEVDVSTGASREVISSPLAVAADIALVGAPGAEEVIVADVFSVRGVDVATGAVREFGRVFADTVDYPVMAGSDGETVLLTSYVSGTMQTLDPATGVLGPLAHDLGVIVDALPLGDGTAVWLDLATGTLTRAPLDDLAARRVIADGLMTPGAMVRASDEAVYVGEMIPGRIVRVALETGETTVIAEGLDGPEGMALDGDGHLVVAEVGARRLVRIDPATGSRSVIADDLPMGLAGTESSPPGNIPTGVVVTAAGDIIFSSDTDAGLYRLRKD